MDILESQIASHKWAEESCTQVDARGSAPLRIFLQGSEAVLSPNSPLGSAPYLEQISPMLEVSAGDSEETTLSPPPTPTGERRGSFPSPPLPSSRHGFQSSSTGGISHMSSLSVSPSPSSVSAAGPGPLGPPALAHPHLHGGRSSEREDRWSTSSASTSQGLWRPMPMPMPMAMAIPVGPRNAASLPSAASPFGSGAFIPPSTERMLPSDVSLSSLGLNSGFESTPHAVYGGASTSRNVDLTVYVRRLEERITLLEQGQSIIQSSLERLATRDHSFQGVQSSDPWRQSSDTRLSSIVPSPPGAVHTQYRHLLGQLQSLQSQVDYILQQHQSQFQSSGIYHDAYLGNQEQQAPLVYPEVGEGLRQGLECSSVGGEGTTSSAAATAASGDDAASHSSPNRSAARPLEERPNDQEVGHDSQGPASQNGSSRTSLPARIPASSPSAATPLHPERSSSLHEEEGMQPVYGGNYGKKVLALRTARQSRTGAGGSDEGNLSSVSGSSSGRRKQPPSSVSDNVVPSVITTSCNNDMGKSCSNDAKKRRETDSSSRAAPFSVDGDEPRPKKRARPRRRMAYNDWGNLTRRRRKRRPSKASEAQSLKDTGADSTDGSKGATAGLALQTKLLATIDRSAGLRLLQGSSPVSSLSSATFDVNLTSQSVRPLTTFFPGSPQKSRWWRRRGRTVVRVQKVGDVGTSSREFADTPRAEQSFPAEGPRATSPGTRSQKRAAASVEAKRGRSNRLTRRSAKARLADQQSAHSGSVPLSEENGPFFASTWRKGHDYSSGTEDSMGETTLPLEELQAHIRTNAPESALREPSEESWIRARLFVERLRGAIDGFASGNAKLTFDVNGTQCAVLINIKLIKYLRIAQQAGQGHSSHSLLRLLLDKLPLYITEAAYAFEAVTGEGPSSAPLSQPEMELEIETTRGTATLKASFGTDDVDHLFTTGSSSE